MRDGLGGHLPRLWRYDLVLSRSKDAAENLVQATCLRAIERAARFAGGSRLDRRLFTILHPIWIDQVRARRIRLGHGFVDAEAEGVLALDGEAAIEARVLASQVLCRVGAFPEAQRETVFLAYVEGLSYRETAEVLSIPIGTVMSRLAGARAQLASVVACEPRRTSARGRVLFPGKPSDETLVTSSDGELEAAEREAVEVWLRRDASVSARLSVPTGSALPFAASFDHLLA